MHFDHVGLSVGDLDAQLAWYQAAFGFASAKPFAIPPAGLRGVFLIGPDGMAIELLEKSGSMPLGTPPTDPPSGLLQQGYRHLCFRVDDVDAWFARLTEHGAAIVAPPASAPEPGSRFCFVADPEGNLIEFLDRTGPVGS